MYQVLPFKIILIIVAWLIASILLLSDWVALTLGVPIPVRWAIFLVDLLFLLLTLKVVWRFLWRKFPVLGKIIFPDLNGDYDVTLQHNWPIQQRLLEAAASADDSFDPRQNNEEKIEFGTTNIKAKIDMGFFKIKIRMWPKYAKKDGSVIDNSRTIAVNLLREEDGYGKRVAYVYQQKNAADKQAITDSQWFEGCALIEIEEGEEFVMKGEYWTNRAWHAGINTAGKIRFEKTPVSNLR